MDNRPHVVKLRHFESVFPHPLENNEWRVKWPSVGEWKTYNPDYHCPALGCYIEVATSKPNIAESRRKWAHAIRTNGLRVFWWEGNEITNEI